MDQPGSSIAELNSRQKQQSQRHVLREVRMGADRPKPEIIAAISKWDPKPPPQAQRANAECNENPHIPRCFKQGSNDPIGRRTSSLAVCVREANPQHGERLERPRLAESLGRDFAFSLLRR